MNKSDIHLKRICFLVGFITIFLFLYNDVIFGNYKLSFANINYVTAPFNSLGIDIKGPSLSDVADQIYTSIYKTFYSGEPLSLWNNCVAMGMPSEDIGNLLNPFNWVYFLPMGTAIFVKSLIKLLLGFVSMYLYMRSIGVKTFSAAAAAVIYIFSATMVMWFGWPHTDVAAIAPLLFFLIERLIKTLDILYMLLISIVVYIMLIVGMPTFAAYFLYLAGVYIVIFTFKEHFSNKKNIAAVGCMFGLAVVLGGIMSLPYTYDLVMNVGANGYAGSRTALAETRLTMDYIRTFLFPYLRDGLDISQNEATLYIGILPVIVIPLFVINILNKKRGLFYIISSVVIFILIFTSLLNPVFRMLPTINTSLKTRIITLLMFTMSCLTGLTLNDILTCRSFYTERKRTIIPILCIWTLLMACLTIYFLFNNNMVEMYSDDLKRVSVLILLCFAIIFLTLAGRAVNNRLILIALMLVIIYDGTCFARKNLPFIDKKADIIPETTDSVDYLKNNIKNNERYVGIGDWFFFPDTGVYYGINDIRAHNFIVTNKDIEKYYKLIDDDCYASRTRIAFRDIANYELLKYLGVKYIAFEQNSREKLTIDKGDSRQPLGQMNSDDIVSQEFYTESKVIGGIDILLSTYKTIPVSSESIIISLLEKDRVLARAYLPLNEIEDNTYKTIYFDKPVHVQAGTYSVSIGFPDMERESITLWKSNDNNNHYSINNTENSGSIVMNILYDNENAKSVFRGKDMTEIAELDQYAPKAELAEVVEIYSDEDTLLNAMAEGYVKNKAFVLNDTDVREYNSPLNENESVEILEYENDYIKLSCNSAQNRLVLFNDYYADGWKAYVNGRQTDIIKSNFLTRAVEIPKGSNIIVEMRYKQDSFNITIYCAVFALMLLILVSIFRSKLQLLLIKILGERKKLHEQ